MCDQGIVPCGSEKIGKFFQFRKKGTHHMYYEDLSITNNWDVFAKQEDPMPREHQRPIWEGVHNKFDNDTLHENCSYEKGGPGGGVSRKHYILEIRKSSRDMWKF